MLTPADHTWAEIEARLLAQHERACPAATTSGWSYGTSDPCSCMLAERREAIRRKLLEGIERGRAA